ncbi:two-component system response regulator [Variovorax paradoxus]|jgi:two-component system response regulator BaeR|uniref:response regulator n=1 Tax=Variovorax TaxID=34072 RepID=UPI0006E4C251|nr:MULTISPECIES: response regulator [unclassified Variovorax]KPU94650.1 two-component system response regulator [Variovorax paradoxus]KPV08839.1 two-component system response regulator [Variovorax paradoxus]KPV11336.1 two-component system response regulator [Variovorax paradoxus]KPV23227.1 two-component system response regulator [Variovorax paradoxus]KPV26770.1 two-component system response regulator [Variovorax paradoxus]
MTRIVIVEDEADIASVVQDYLRHAGYETTHFADGQSALESIVAAPPDLTLLDIMLPRLDGIEVLRRAREHTAHPIIMLTARIEEVDRLLGLELGADDYVCKPFSPRELVARVRAVLRRAAPGLSDPGAPGRAATDAAPGLVLDDVHWRASLEGTPLNLTRREFGLLQVLSRHPGRIFSRARLLELAYDDTVDVTERAIDSHVKNLRRKLGAVTPGHDWIRSVYGVGFAWEAPPPAD